MIETSDKGVRYRLTSNNKTTATTTEKTELIPRLTPALKCRKMFDMEERKAKIN